MRRTHNDSTDCLPLTSYDRKLQAEVATYLLTMLAGHSDSFKLTLILPPGNITHQSPLASRFHSFLEIQNALLPHQFIYKLMNLVFKNIIKLYGRIIRMMLQNTPRKIISLPIVVIYSGCIRRCYYTSDIVALKVLRLRPLDNTQMIISQCMSENLWPPLSF